VGKTTVISLDVEQKTTKKVRTKEGKPFFGSNIKDWRRGAVRSGIG
jgi:hypothetical protein